MPRLIIHSITGYKRRPCAILLRYAAPDMPGEWPTSAYCCSSTVTSTLPAFVDPSCVYRPSTSERTLQSNYSGGTQGRFESANFGHPTSHREGLHRGHRRNRTTHRMFPFRSEWTQRSNLLTCTHGQRCLCHWWGTNCRRKIRRRAVAYPSRRSTRPNYGRSV